MSAPRRIKCVIWDLDETLWRGTLAEDGAVSLREGAAAVVRELDARGVLQSVATRGDERSLAELDRLGLGECFVEPELVAGAKSEAICRIAEKLGVSLDAVAFIDDEPFEREEVRFTHPDVLCLEASAIDTLLDRPELAAPSGSAVPRRALYLTDRERRRLEASFAGPKEAFLATLGMRFTIRPARAEDLARAEELTLRTHQLNTTGAVHSREDLAARIGDPRSLVLVADLADRLGGYGAIGLAVIDRPGSSWTLSLLLLSCRVLDRGLGSIFLGDVMRRALAAGASLAGRFRPNDRNRRMLLTYKLCGFREIDRRGDEILLGSDLADLPPIPGYLEVLSEAEAP
jgi:FkbH-like protein